MMLGDNRYQNNKPELPDELISNHVAVLGNPLGPMEKPVEQVAWKWHHDKDALPRIVGLNMNALYIVMLHVHKVPEQDMDGNPHTTEFLDQIEAWRSFEPDRQAQLRKIKLKHFPPMFNQKQGEDVTTEYPSKAHPLVTEHELTAREGLYMGSDTAIPSGMDSQPEKACQFWHQLLDDILSSCTVYSHHWQEGDIVFWDNSQVMHRGKPYDSRKYQRIGLRLGVVAREETALRHQPG